MTADVPDEGGISGNTFRGPTAFQSGSHSIQHNYFYTRQPAAVSWPHQVGVLPRRADGFQPRGEERQLAEAVVGGGMAVLSGVGGVGKTQLAAHYARRTMAEDKLDLLVWVTATTREAITTAYAQAAAEILGTNEAGPERAAERFLAWLEPKPATTGSRPRRWLVVLDDVADPADLRGLWPPSSPHGWTLITTRRRDEILQGGRRRLVPVGLFTASESAAYLTATLADHGRAEPPEEIMGLAADLGYLPLALSQAAAYLIDTDMGCAAYRRLLTDHARALADLLPEDHALPDDQTANAAAVWSLSIDRADHMHPVGLARPMLHLTAMLDPNGIPAAVLTSPPALIYLALRRSDYAILRAALRRRLRRWPWSRPGKPTQATPEEALSVLRSLHRLSLIDHTPTTAHRAVRVHQLIQRTVRDTLDPHQHAFCADVAGYALVSAWAGDEPDESALTEALRANTEALMQHAEDALYQSRAHPVLFHMGDSLGETGQYRAASNHFRRLADTASHRLGPDHPHTLIARANLAFSQGWAHYPRLSLLRIEGENPGAAADTVAAVAELLPDLIRVLGPDHPDTLIIRVDYANWRAKAGDSAGASADFAELLPDLARVLGPDSQRTLYARHQLAHFRGLAGDAAGAAAAVAELLPDLIRVLGPDYGWTLIARCNVAGWRGEAGDVAGVEAAFAELAPDLKRALGYSAPHTVTTRYGDIILGDPDSGDEWGTNATIADNGVSFSRGPRVLIADDLLSVGLHLVDRYPGATCETTLGLGDRYATTTVAVSGDLIIGDMDAGDSPVDESTD
ncbi:NB-ARC domain-containing protein [Streptomyces sp. URMC 128]|uniref:NB-ARC domain-containing protein n=1 Tax=Streptomyces sp. URMC 128 TaxID=3423404 RepID=UPI003F1B0F9B